jgi:hypothetical protein
MREPLFRGNSQNSENRFKKDSFPKNFFHIEVWRDGNSSLKILVGYEVR